MILNISLPEFSFDSYSRNKITCFEEIYLDSSCDSLKCVDTFNSFNTLYNLLSCYSNLPAGTLDIETRNDFKILINQYLQNHNLPSTILEVLE